MTESTTPEKKSGSKKALYWSLAIGIVGALCLPNEVKLVIVGSAVTAYVAYGLIGLARLRKKLDPVIKVTDAANKRWQREVNRARHLTNASLYRGRDAMEAKNPHDLAEAEADKKLFAGAAREVQVKLNPSPDNLNRLVDKLPKRKR